MLNEITEGLCGSRELILVILKYQNKFFKHFFKIKKDKIGDYGGKIHKKIKEN